jgi:hypothetical protein
MDSRLSQLVRQYGLIAAVALIITLTSKLSQLRKMVDHQVRFQPLAAFIVFA